MIKVTVFLFVMNRAAKVKELIVIIRRKEISAVGINTGRYTGGCHLRSIHIRTKPANLNRNKTSEVTAVTIKDAIKILALL